MNKKKDTRKKIQVLLNESERQIIEEKMKKYGYRTLASYVRDASIYESLTIYDLEGKTEVAQAMDRMAESVRLFTAQLDMLLLRRDMDQYTSRSIRELEDKVTMMQKNMEKLVEERLWNTKTVVSHERKPHADH